MAWNVLDKVDKRLKTIIGIITSIGVAGYCIYLSYDFYYTVERYKKRVDQLEERVSRNDSVYSIRIYDVEQYIDNEVVRFNSDSTFQVGFRSDKTTLFYRDKDGIEYKLYRSEFYSTEDNEWFFYVKENGVRYWISNSHYQNYPGSH